MFPTWLCLGDSNFLGHMVAEKRTREIIGLNPCRSFLEGRNELICSTIKLKLVYSLF